MQAEDASLNFGQTALLSCGLLINCDPHANTLHSILFLVTAGISIFYVIKAKKSPELNDPWLAPQGAQKYKPTGMGDMENNKHEDPVWDHNTQDLDGRDSDDDQLGGRTHESESDHDGHPDRPVHWGQGPQSPFDDAHSAPSYQDTEYRGGGGSNYQPPSAMSPTDIYTPQNRDPSNYGGTTRSGRSGGGYSFSNPHADA